MAFNVIAIYLFFYKNDSLETTYMTMGYLSHWFDFWKSQEFINFNLARHVLILMQTIVLNLLEKIQSFK